jgi:hypothetical protein
MTTTARVMRSLETVLFEVGEMRRTLHRATIDDATRRALDLVLTRMGADAQAAMDWLSESRLESPSN